MNKTYMSDTKSNPISSTVQDRMRQDSDVMPYPTSAEYKQLIEENIGYRDFLITHLIPLTTGLNLWRNEPGA